MEDQGFLAIWTDIDEEHFLDYRRWLATEHIGQRIYAQGFLAARVHVAPDNQRSHFILYATESRHVPQSPSYLEVLNNPTPWTQKMMPRLRKFDRAAGRQVTKIGDGAGAWLVVSRISAAFDSARTATIREELEALCRIRGVVTLRLFQVDRNATDIPSAEKAMRAGAEGAFRSLLVIETSSEDAAAEAEQRLDRLIGDIAGSTVAHDANRYCLAFALHPFERPAN